jgi:hypothetical protein
VGDGRSVDHGRRNVRKISWITAVIHDFGASRRPRLAGERPAVPRRSSKSPDSPVGGGREPGNRGRDFNKSAPVHRPHSIRHIDRAARPQVRIERTSITTRPRLANYRRMARVRLSACPSESLSTTTVGCSTAPVGRPLHGLAGRWGASPHGGDATINASSCTTPPG